MFKLALSLSQLGCPVQNDDNARMSNYLFFEDIFKRYFESRRRNRILNVHIGLKSCFHIFAQLIKHRPLRYSLVTKNKHKLYQG